MANRVTESSRQAFVIELVAKPGTDAARALRALLKVALRKFNLRCVEAREIDTISSGRE